ncbi:MAG TPA: SHOCT domain-containing protein [Desulfuromonadales bacterium]|nr:SHOCT domain-containing protein [Desulfuromonadales bacterium]
MMGWFGNGYGNGFCGFGPFSGGGFTGGGFAGGGFLNLIFWLVVIVLVVWLVRSLLTHHNSRPSAAPSAMEVLKRRYAAGEIDKEEYGRMKRELAS